MTALEYFEHQFNKHMISYGQAAMRGATDEELQNISRKIRYYSLAVEALIAGERSRKMNEAIKLEEVNPCAECRDCVGCEVCHREDQV
jgi:hypothetical protein